jgi:uncharacterized protein YbbK (DUF523 family)/uncharacterized protein YbgA (DUF1722 family)
MTRERIRLGISACLLGEPVRFDGGHKRDPFLVESLGQFVDWVPVCPEVESGLDAPRESMRLVQADGRIRLLTNKTAQDHTTRMRSYARRRVEELVDGELCGFVLKKDSPTCGLERVKVYGAAEVPAKSGRGLFADALVTRFPLLPVEEEGRLNDPRLRENFVERIFAYRRLTALFATHWSMGAVVRFHTAHKLTLMAHMPKAYQRLGRLVASGTSMARREFQERYSSEFMTALSTLATPRRHANVLQHMLGYFKQVLDRESRAELLALIGDYAGGRVPLVGAAHAVRPSHPALRGAVSGRPGLSTAASGRADVAEPRVTAISKKVIITECRRCAAGSTLACDRPTRGGDSEALRTGDLECRMRQRGRPALGVRQPKGSVLPACREDGSSPRRYGLSDRSGSAPSLSPQSADP